MLKLKVDAAETYENATRPAILDAAVEILNFYGVRRKMEIRFNGEPNAARLYGQQYDEKLRDDEQTEFINNNKVFVTYNEEDTEFNTGYGNLGTNATNLPFWHDKRTRSTITPDFIGRKYSVELTTHINTRQDAINFRNRLQQKFDREGGRPVVDPVIHYPINHEILYSAYLLWDLGIKGGVFPTPAPDEKPAAFTKWFKEHSMFPITTVTNGAGNNPIYAIQRQLREISLILSQPTIQQTKQSSAGYLGRYEITFGFTFYFQELTSMEIEYPLMIMQNRVPHELLPTKYKRLGAQQPKHQFLEKTYIEQVKSMDMDRWHDYERFPGYDNWYPPEEDGLVAKLILNVTVKDEDRPSLLNIFELEKLDWHWNPIIRDFLIQYRKVATMRGELILLVRAYSDDLRVNEDQLELMEDGELYLTRKPTMANNYRVVIFIDRAMEQFSERGRNTFVDDKNYQVNVFPAVFPWWNWKRYSDWTDSGDPDDKPVNDLDDYEDIVKEIGREPYGRIPPTHNLSMNLSVR